MFKIIYIQKWWSVGENLGTINQSLTFIDLFKNLFPNKFHYTVNFLDNKFIIENCINIEFLKTIADEIHIESQDYTAQKLVELDYIKLFKDNSNIFIRKTDYEEVKKLSFIYDGIEYYDFFKSIEFFYNEVHSHNLNRIRHQIPILGEDRLGISGKKHNCYVDLNEKIYNKSIEILKENKVSEFETIMFKWEQPMVKDSSYNEIEKYVESFSKIIDKNKKYFLSSNNSLFYKIFEEKFGNCFYIDRGKYDMYGFDNPNERKDNIPKILDFDVTNLTSEVLSNFIAHIELGIICKSKEIFYTNDNKRNMISLFLWLPILKYSIPINWLNIPSSLHIRRVYNFNECISQEIKEIK